MSDSLKKNQMPRDTAVLTRHLKRCKIVEGFHQLYLRNIEAETKKNARLRGITGERLKGIFNETIADYYEQLLVTN